MIDRSFFCPQEQGRERKDCSGCNGFTGRTDRLDKVVFQNGVSAKDDADDSHGNNRRRNRGGDRHTDTQTQICIRRTENDGEQNTNQERGYRELRYDTVGRDIRLEIIFVIRHAFPRERGDVIISKIRICYWLQ